MDKRKNKTAQNNNAISPSERLLQFQRACAEREMSCLDFARELDLHWRSVYVMAARYCAAGYILRANPGTRPALYRMPESEVSFAPANPEFKKLPPNLPKPHPLVAVWSPAMYLGHDSRRAVEVACALDMHCGNGVDTLTL